MNESEVKEKILLETELLFMRYGFKSITMDDIARELGISKKTLYQHFTDKNDLVDQCVEHHIRIMNATCTNLSLEKENPITAMIQINEYIGNILRTLNPSSLFDLKKYFKASWDKLEANRTDFIFQHIRDNISLGQRKGWYRKDFDTDTVCYLYIHLVSLLMEPAGFDASRNLNTLYREIIKYHLRSICSVKGLEFLEEKLKEVSKQKQ